jgi:glucuronosyltransferase
MSLGTNIKSNMLDSQTLKNILKTFAQLPQYNFIWKFESEIDKLPTVPSKNVFIAKFLPQNDILAHQKVKAFVTHSGLLGTQEAMWYGKPMIGIPFFCDQIRTIAKSIRLGIAVDLNFRTFTVEDFKKAILTVVEVPSYSENAKRISKLFQDKPQKPLETALWWIDFVMRNPSAPQFDPPSLKLGWFAANSYDIILTVIVGFHFVIFITFKITKFMKNLLTKSESKKLKSS